MLKGFADRQHITYPLSDPDATVIRAYDILKETAKPGTPTYGTMTTELLFESTPERV